MKRCLIILIFSYYIQIISAQTNHYYFEHESYQQQNQTNLDINQNPLFNYYDVKFYKLDLNIINYTDSFGGNVIVQVESRTNQFDIFAIELSNKLTVDSVYLFGVQHSFVHTNDELKIATTLPITIGTVFSVQIYYHTPTGYTSSYFQSTRTNTGIDVTQTFAQPYFAHEWYPCKQDLKDKADSVHVFVTTNQNLKAGSIGVLTSTILLPQNNVRYEWKSNYPIEYYLISITVSDYVESSFYANPVGSPKPILIQNYIFNDPQQFSNITKANETKALLELFSDLYGLYPFWEEKYGHCMFKSWITGMEHQTMSSMRNLEFWLIAHELAHQWFGNNVTNKSWQDIWLHEGFASYSEYLGYEFLKTKSEADNWMTDCHNDAYLAPSGSVFVPLNDLNNWQRIFNHHLTYRKGAALVHMIRYELDNDSIFFNVLQNYQSQFKDSVASNQDFKNILESTSGMDFTDFFDQWYFGEGFPIYKVKWSQQDEYVVLNVLQYTTSPATQFFSTPIEFRLYHNDGDTIVRFYQTDNNQIFRIKVPFEAFYVEVDPNNWVLNSLDYIIDCPPKSLNIGNDSSICEGDSLVFTGNFGIGNYLWNDSLSTTDKSLTIKSTGDYYVLFTDTNVCSYTSNTIHVKVYPVPTLKINGLDSGYCVNSITDTIYGIPPGGTMFIDSLQSNIFDPSTLELGNHNVTYTFLTIDTFFNKRDQIIYEDGFETNKGWILGGEFQIDSPQGLGGEHGGIDPLTAYQGSKVLGTDLTGLGTYHGDYEPNSTNRATSPIINCSNFKNVKLKFQRWLNVEQPNYDSAYIQVSSNMGFTWTTIWWNSMELTDFFWSLFTFDISSFADNNPNVRLRFNVDSDEGWHYSGWNIDNLKLVGQSMDTLIDTLCSHSIQIPVIINSTLMPEVGLGNDTAYCEGFDYYLDAGNGFLWYDWNDSISGGRFYSAEETGIYFVKVTDSNYCSNTSDTVFIEVYESPYVNLGNDTSIYKNQTIILSPENGYVSYVWNDNTTDQNKVIIGSEQDTGSYSFFVKVTDTNGCTNSDTIIITILSGQNVNSSQKAILIKLYPNPSNGLLFIEIANIKYGEMIMELYDVNMKLITDKLVSTSSGSTNDLIDISDYPKGLYFIKFINKEFIVTKKVLKN